MPGPALDLGGGDSCKLPEVREEVRVPWYPALVFFRWTEKERNCVLWTYAEEGFHQATAVKKVRVGRVEEVESVGYSSKRAAGLNQAKGQYHRNRTELLRVCSFLHVGTSNLLCIFLEMVLLTFIKQGVHPSCLLHALSLPWKMSSPQKLEFSC